MKTKNLVLTSLIAVATIPAFAADVQNKDPYTNGQAVTKVDSHTDGARRADVYTSGTVCKADPYTDDALHRADPYTDGVLVGKADPFADGR